ncbi:MAG: HAD-IG family 5'-nucleotidase [Candidatus Wallbacteria bacterium]|nr:HAD-IG family 5'-nucleotidase [Candidatus Wallbacteria bacterium]
MYEKNHSRPVDVVLDDESLNLIEPEEGIEKGRRIFVNRNLRLDKIKAVGFDMDHTLAVYNRDTIEPLDFSLTIERMISMGYPDSLKGIPYDKNTMIRGLVIDKKHGNILKVDRHGYISVARHAGRVLGSVEKRGHYQNERIDLKEGRFNSIDTLFGIPEILLFFHLTDMKDRGDAFISTKSYTEIYDDVRVSIDGVHRDDTLKSRVLSDLMRYFKKDVKLPLCLHKFRKSGKKLFLLTNSEEYYTEKVLSCILSGNMQQYPDYKDFFDLIICRSGKPDFYQIEKPFCDGQGKMRQGGCAREMEKLLGCRGDEILYFGDHTFGDILVAKKYLGWRTAMVIEELESEIHSQNGTEGLYEEYFHCMRERDEKYLATSKDFRRINALRLKKVQNFGDLTRADLESIDAEYQELFTKIGENERQITEALVFLRDTEQRIMEQFNPLWGPLFKAGMEKSNFGRQVETYACVYTSRVSNFFLYPADKYFMVLRDLMPHEL